MRSDGLTPSFVRCQFCFQLDSLIVVETNVLLDHFADLLERWILAMAKSFFLEMAEETFHGGIVPAIAAPGHRRLHPQFPRLAMIIMGAIMRSLVTMQNDARRVLNVLSSLSEGSMDERPGVLRTDLMGHDEAIIEILDRREIRPALLGPNVGHIGDPLLIWLSGLKVALEQVRIVVVDLHSSATPVGFAPPRNGSNAYFAHQSQDRLMI